MSMDAAARAVIALAATLILCAATQVGPPPPRAPSGQEPPPLRVTLRGTAYAVPRAYVEVSFGSEGVALRADARTFAAWTPAHGARLDQAEARRAFLAYGLSASLRADRRWSGEVVAAQVANSKRQSFHEPGEEADELPAGGGPVPPGLRLHRALPDPRRPASAIVMDMLVPDDAPPGYGPTPFGEAIFCTSPLNSAVVTGMQTLANLRCEHAFAHRDLVVEVNYERRHLPRWRAIREGVRALLDAWAVDNAPPPLAR